MCRIIVCAATALSAFSFATLPAAADDRVTREYESEWSSVGRDCNYIERAPEDGEDYYYYYRGRCKSTIYKENGFDLDQAIRLNPKNPKYYLARGDAYMIMGEYDRSLADYDEAIRLDPNVAGAYRRRSYSHSGKGRLDDAIADYDELIKRNPEPRDYLGRGGLYAEKGDLDRAIADYDEAIRRDPVPGAYLARSMAYSRKGQPDRAADDREKAGTADYIETPARAAGDDRETCKYVKDLPGMYGGKRLAVDACSRLIERDPKDAEAYYRRGTLGGVDGNSGISDLDQAIGLDPANPRYHFVRGQALEMHAKYDGKYDRAMADYDEAIRLDPKNFNVYEARAEAYLHHAYDRAITDLDEVIRRNPNAFSAYSARAEAYVARDGHGDYDRAIADYDQVIRIHGTTLDFVYRGRLLAKKGELDLAIADFDEAIKREPDAVAIAYEGRGEAYIRKHEYDRAIADYDRALEINPHYQEALDHREVALAAQTNAGKRQRAKSDKRQRPK
jgi:tetratricopeptide (TPR) repeat protein